MTAVVPFAVLQTMLFYQMDSLVLRVETLITISKPKFVLTRELFYPDAMVSSVAAVVTMCLTRDTIGVADHRTKLFQKYTRVNSVKEEGSTLFFPSAVGIGSLIVRFMYLKSVVAIQHMILEIIDAATITLLCQ